MTPEPPEGLLNEDAPLAEASAEGAVADGPLKDVLKEALTEVLREQREFIQGIVEDALQELTLAEALREADAHERRFARRPGFRAVEGEA